VKQKDIFLESEGNAWLERNRGHLGQYDPVSTLIETHGYRPKCVLEVGCANGWRLAKLKEKYGCEVTGVEPSLRACIEGAELGIPIVHGTASMLPFAPERFDMIIFGFCLYLADPEDWLRIAAEADTVLKRGGFIVVHDFNTLEQHEKALARGYEHRDGVMSYHFEFQGLWLAHPNYSSVNFAIGAHDDLVEIIRKNPNRLCAKS
jgi:SAM-dependent methyltransferase